MVYALLAERADAQDLAELALAPHMDDAGRKNVGLNRAELDAVLAQPIGKQAVADAALLRAIGGAA